MSPDSSSSPIAELNPERGELVRVVSDLHLGHERSRFAGMDAWRKNLRGCRHLVVAGDLAETRCCEFREKGLALRARFDELCREEGVELHVVAGNHDPDEPVQLLRLWKGKAVVFHGHSLFRNVAPWGWEFILHKKECKRLIASHACCDTDLEDRLALAHEMSLLSPPVLRLGKPARTPLGRFIQHCVWPPSRPISIVMAWLTMGSRVHHFTESFFPDARIVCFGHFHRSGEWRRGGRRYFNTGAHFKNATATAVDLVDGEVAGVRRVALKPAAHH